MSTLLNFQNGNFSQRSMSDIDLLSTKSSPEESSQPRQINNRIDAQVLDPYDEYYPYLDNPVHRSVQQPTNTFYPIHFTESQSQANFTPTYNSYVPANNLNTMPVQTKPHKPNRAITLFAIILLTISASLAALMVLKFGAVN